MLDSDSVLLEIYREDVCREYSNSDYMLGSYTLKNNNKRDILYEDLINLANEVYLNENEYCYKKIVKDSIYFRQKFTITNRLINGIKSSLIKASIDTDKKEPLIQKLNKLSDKIKNRIEEIEMLIKF